MTDTDTVPGQGSAADTYVTAEEAAKLADVSARTVRRWINAGEVQAEDGPRGRLVSVSDVRLRAARGHVRPRPSSTTTTSRTDRDADNIAVMSAVSDRLAPQLTEITAQIERLTREAMEEKARADSAEQRAGELAAELERVSAELLAAQIAAEVPKMPENDDSRGVGATQAAQMADDASHTPQGSESRSWWRRLIGLD